ncbi:Lyzozyme M1 (1,4-beta-N-acetylmuramidase) [Minicystis rosea]|nr:Lyzozyme M1 (1,4-beta-N-acetylmuramidase) [Minicystis rosea]
MLRGIDISHGQGNIDWDKLAPQLDFVFIKATQSSGPQWADGPVSRTCFADSKFKTNREKAKAHNLIRGYYHFAIPSYVAFHDALDAAGGKAVSPSDYQSDAAEQANFFCDTVGALEPGELDLVLDLEATKYSHGDHTLNDEERRELQAWTVTFIETVQARYPGRTVIIYTYSAFVKSMVSSAAPMPPSILACPLWIAALSHGTTGTPPQNTAEWESWATTVDGKGYNPRPPVWPSWAFWQFSWKSHLDGMPSASTDVDADLFFGSMAELRRFAHLDSIVYPLDQDAPAHYAVNEGGDGGFFPIGANNFWHGGIHLDTRDRLQSVADGKLVAYRATKKPLEITLGGQKLPLSSGFMLTHHTRYTPKGAKIDFFTLYAHTQPIDSYTDAQKEAPPPLFSKPKIVVSTAEDGHGMAARDAADQGTILGVIPKWAYFDVVPNAKASWSTTAKKVVWGAVSGFAEIETRSLKISGNTYQCTTLEDAPAEALMGLNVRNASAGKKVIRVAPLGSKLELKDMTSAVQGGKLVAGWYELSGGGWVCIRTSDSPTATLTFTLDGAQLDKVIKVDRPIAPGIVLGYPGPYFTKESTVHVEIFTADVGFMKNPKGDKGGPTTLKVPAGTVFKKRKDSPDELIQIDAPADAQMRVIKKGDPYLKVEVLEYVGWTQRDALGDYNSSTRKYTLQAPLETLLLGDPETGEPLTINAAQGTKITFYKQDGDHRKVGYPLLQSEREPRTGFALPVELGKPNSAKDRYTLAGPLATLHKVDPTTLVDFSEDAGKNAADLWIDLLVTPDPAVFKDASGKIWQEAEFAPGQKGWFRQDAPGIKPFSAYDWPRWQRIQDYGNFSDDGLCDAAEIVGIVDTDGDGEMTSTEIKHAMQDPRYTDKFRYLACMHPTEWAGELKGIERLGGPPWHIGKEMLDATKDYIKKLGYWDDLAGADLPSKTKVWHVHPIAFLEHLRKLTLLPTAPATIVPAPTTGTEVFLLCGHKVEDNPRCVRDKLGKLEVVASVSKGKDTISVLHHDSAAPSPASLQIKGPNNALIEAKAGTTEGGDYTQYTFDAEHTAPDNFNIISGEFWQQLFLGRTYRIQNLARPVDVIAYPTHKWKLGIKFPAMKSLKVGSKLEKQSMAVAGPGYFGAAKKTTHTLEIEKTGWKKVKETTSVETSKATGVVVTNSQIAVINQNVAKLEYTQEAASNKVVSAVSLSRDNEDISLKKVPALKALFSIVEVVNDIMGVIRAIQDNVPKVGWYAEVEVQVLQGKLGLEWQWKEHRDHRAFLWMKAGIEMTLFSISLEIGVGVSGCSFKAQVFAKVEGAVETALSAERVSPDAWDAVQIPLKVSITGTVGARFEAGNFINVEATLETALEVEGTLKLNTSKGLGASVSFTWTGLKGKINASIGKGGSLGSYSGSQTFIDSVDLGSSEWPSPEPYNPEYTPRARIKEIISGEVTGFWNGIQVYSGDRAWSDDEMVEKLTKKIDSRTDIRRDTRSIEGLVKDIRQRLDGKRKDGGFWRGEYIEGAAFDRFVYSGELDGIMTTSYVDPCKDMLNKVGP